MGQAGFICVGADMIYEVADGKVRQADLILEQADIICELPGMIFDLSDIISRAADIENGRADKENKAAVSMDALEEVVLRHASREEAGAGKRRAVTGAFCCGCRAVTDTFRAVEITAEFQPCEEICSRTARADARAAVGLPLHRAAFAAAAAGGG
jgi:hypothetical protein